MSLSRRPVGLRSRSHEREQAPPAADDEYYVEPWSDRFLQGDIFTDVPIAIAAPPDAVVMVEGERRLVSGPFDAGRRC